MKPVPPLVQKGEAHTYRTVLREQASRGPNFAGHYTVIWIGCGAATVCPAIVNAITGQVHFSKVLRTATALMRDTGATGVEILNYKIDSRLLVVVGTPNEDARKEGMSYYLWDGHKLRLIRFVSAARLCKQH